MDAITRTIYDKLKEVAKYESIIFYYELSHLVGLKLNLPGDRERLEEILNEIGRKEHFAGRPFLPSVAVSMRLKRPGEGFFATAGELGLCGGDVREQALFWIREVGRVHDHWARQD